MSFLMVCVCALVYFLETRLCTQVPELPSGLEFSCGFAYAEASWGVSCVSRSGSAVGGSGNPPVCVCDPQQSNWKSLKSLTIHPGLCERWVTAGGSRAI